MDKIIPYGYVYEITNKINGKTYVGSRKLSRDKSWRQYMGSGKLIKNSIAKYGKQNFIKSLLCYEFSAESLAEKEYEFIRQKRKDGFAQYNLYLGMGAGGNTFARLKNKTLEDVRNAQSEGLKKSEKARRRYENMRSKKWKIDSTFAHDNKEELISSYNKNKSIKLVAEEFGISKNRARRLLIDILNLHIISRHEIEGTQEFRLRAFEKHFHNKYGKDYFYPLPCPRFMKEDFEYRKCLSCHKSFRTYGSKRKYCSHECRNLTTTFDQNTPSHVSTKKFFISYSVLYDLWIVQRCSLQELQDYLGCQQRTAYAILKEHGLPTVSNRDKYIKENLLLS